MPTPDSRSNNPCPCGSGDPLGDCCGRWLDGAAPTAEALMRSRYTAFVLGRSDYLLATWAPATRPDQVETDDAVRWLGLTIKRCEQGGPDDDTGVVEFTARYKTVSGGHRMHEISRFSRHDGDWVYVDGEQLDTRQRRGRRRGRR